jgi:glucosamine-6-phosphate deaminase
MLIIRKNSYEDISKLSAEIIAQKIRKKPNLVLGLATGSTPLGLYKELINMHKNEGLDFSKITTFNLDEYIGLPKTHNQSYHYFMYENFFNHINITQKLINIPDGMSEKHEIACNQYEDKIRHAGGIDFQILGIGRNGHIAFNEPGSSLSSRTRVKPLSKKTIKDNSRFFTSIDEVPTKAITMGIGTIIGSREILLLANGLNKAEIIKNCIEGPISAMHPASILQMHPKVTVLLDEDAASKLTLELE